MSNCKKELASDMLAAAELKVAQKAVQESAQTIAESKRPRDGLKHSSHEKQKPLREQSVQERRAKTSHEAFLSPGMFHTTKDDQGRTKTIEGWLSSRAGARDSANAGVQQAFRKELGLNCHLDAFHVLAYRHGGPTAEEHGRALASENLVAGDQCMNRSYNACFESFASRHLIAFDSIYCEATIKYRDDATGTRVAEFISYKFYQKDSAGDKVPYTIAEYGIRAGQRPGEMQSGDESSELKRPNLTANRALGGAAGIAGFYSPDYPDPDKWN